jgi:hypothetical protein
MTRARAGKVAVGEGVISDERLAAALWEWWFATDIADDTIVGHEAAAMDDLRTLAEVLDQHGYEIVRKANA